MDATIVNVLRADEYPAYYAGYVSLVPDRSTIEAALAEGAARLQKWVEEQPASRASYAYAPGKWTAAQSLQHVIDCERIFSTRALRIARGETHDQTGFEQDDFAAMAPAASRTLASLAAEYGVVHKATAALFDSFSEADLRRVGSMSGGSTTVRAVGFINAGHALHHARLFADRYTPSS